MQEGDYEAASVASVPAQSPTAQGAAAAAARVPIKEDHDDGEAHHRWADGSEYFGEWHGGQPNGRGIFVWPSGDMCSPSGMQITQRFLGHLKCSMSCLR